MAKINLRGMDVDALLKLQDDIDERLGQKHRELEEQLSRLGLGMRRVGRGKGGRAEQVGLGDKIFDIYAELGNVVSAAVPAAMAIAETRGLLDRGHHVVTWVASAGMSFTTTSFNF
jgi:hypothetical protein